MVDFEKLLQRWNDEQLIQQVSKKNNIVALRSFLKSCAGVNPSKVLLVSWIRDWRGSSLTMQNYASSMRRFFDWLGTEGLYPDIGHGLRNYTRQQFEHTHFPLTEKHVDLLLAHLNEYNQPCRRDACIILLMLNSGLRCCEVRRARICDIFQHDSCTCLRVQGKGHVYPDAYVVLMPHLAKQIESYLEFRDTKNKADPLFVTLDDKNKALSPLRMSTLCRLHLDAVGLHAPRYTAHSLRHTAATIALSRGASEEQVSKMLRHVDPRTTRIYTRFVNRMANPAERSLDFKLPDSAERKIIPISAMGRKA